jgi:hypothetical protein
MSVQNPDGDTDMEPDKNSTSTAGNAGNATGISLAGRVIANPVVSCRTEGDDGALLFNPDNDSALLINPTGILVWNFIGQPRTIDEIVEYITTLFSNNLDHAAIRKDVEAFVTDLAPDFISEV